MFKRFLILAFLAASPAAAYPQPDAALAGDEQLELIRRDAAQAPARKSAKRRPAVIPAVWIVRPIPPMQRPGNIA